MGQHGANHLPHTAKAEIVHKVYLVPGFLGFDRLGGLSYFQRVTDTLTEALAERGLDAEVIELNTRPTASIRRRAVSLIDAVTDTGGLEADSLHFIGHSTGGLDARLLLSPGVRLVADDREEQIGGLTSSMISLSTPHFGTPMATFFSSINGRNILLALTAMVTSRPGRVGAWLGARSLIRLARLDDLLGQRDTLLDSFAEGLFSQVTPAEGGELWQYVRAMSEDQGAMIQLTPAAIDLFNAAVLDREDVDYTCFVSAAPPPGIPVVPGLSGESAYELLTYLVFGLSHRITAREVRQYPYPHPGVEAFDAIQGQLQFDLQHSTNDGVVPALSQVWGRVGGVYVADHLDVVGQFSHVDDDGRRREGWLHSRSNFDEDRFQRLWGDIADTIVAAPAPEVLDLRGGKPSSARR